MEAFTSKSLSEPQVAAYIMGLEDLSEHDLEMGFRRVLRQWNYTVMPPPAFIRECVAAAMEEEKGHRAAELRKREVVLEMPQRRLTVEEAWADWEELQQLEAEARERLKIVRKEKREELRKSFSKDLVIPTRERLDELKKQQQFIRGKYGDIHEGKTIRVRDSVPSAPNEGTSGAERDTEKRSGEPAENGTSAERGGGEHSGGSGDSN